MSIFAGFCKQIRMRLYRNDYGISGTLSRRNQINIEHSQQYNVGDTLGPVIVEWMLEKHRIEPECKVGKTRHLFTVGSIVGRGRCDATVWGSGILRNRNNSIVKMLKRQRVLYGRKHDIRAVRGPVTRGILLASGEECPEVYGDPAILLPMIYEGKRNEVKKKEMSLILHHRTQLIRKKGEEQPYQLFIDEQTIREYDIHLIDPKTDDYQLFVDEILSSKKVISSSLHGIILAESYGIPTVFLNWGMDDQPIKFKDWYYSTGRDVVFARDLSEAIQMQPAPLPKLERLQKSLMDSFPYDLWEK